MPFMTRYRRRWIAGSALAALAFAHAAIAGYGCLQGKMPEPQMACEESQNAAPSFAAPVSPLIGGFMAFACPGRFARPLVCLIGLALSAPLAYAASTEPLPLAEALKIGEKISPRLAAQGAALAAATELVPRASELPDPKLRIGVDNLPVN